MTYDKYPNARCNHLDKDEPIASDYLPACPKFKETLLDSEGYDQGYIDGIEDACRWLKEKLSNTSMTPEEIKWCKAMYNEFRKEMEEYL